MDNNYASLSAMASKCGLIVGAYYIIRFSCMPLSLHAPAVGILFALMTAGAPFFNGYITMVAREKVLGGVMSFWQGALFSFKIMFYGSLLEALWQYIYFSFIDKGKINNWLLNNISELKDNGISPSLIEVLEESAGNLAQLTPIEVAMNSFVNGIIWIAIISLLIGFVSKRKVPKQTI